MSLTNFAVNIDSKTSGTLKITKRIKTMPSKDTLPNKIINK